MLLIFEMMWNLNSAVSGTFSLEELIANCNFFYIILASSDEFDETSIFK